MTAREAIARFDPYIGTSVTGKSFKKPVRMQSPPSKSVRNGARDADSVLMLRLNQTLKDATFRIITLGNLNRKNAL